MEFRDINGSRWVTAGLALLLCGTPAATAHAQDALPGAATIIARYVQSIGGARTILALGSMHSVGSYSVPSMGLTGEVETFQMQPHRTFTRVTIPGIGDILRGYDGTVGWSLNPMEGPRLLDGDELKQMHDESDLRSMVRDPQLVESMTTVERTEQNGAACYRVKIVWKSGRQSTDCYALDTGLLVASTVTVTSPMGQIDAIIFYDEYRDFEGIKLPTLTRQQLMGTEQTFQIRSVEFGRVDPAIFQLPPEIQALRR